MGAVLKSSKVRDKDPLPSRRQVLQATRHQRKAAQARSLPTVFVRALCAAPVSHVQSETGAFQA